MIISASRRTDIPAFYFDWFCQRLKAGYADVVNPFNRKQVSRISLIHGCHYCYANASLDRARQGFERHDKEASVITGNLLGDEKIIVHD